jgi:predicted AlkP superfamily phosphohydrolase/phosphomutase
VYGRRRRPNHSYASPATPDSRDIAEPRLWDMLGAAGKYVGVVGAPATAPPPPVRGHLIAERVADGAIVTHPPELARQVAAWLDDDPPADQAHGDDLDIVVGRAYARAERRFRLARRLLARATYDCFVLFDDGIAEVQRVLWHTLDVTHPRHVPNHPFKDAIGAFYRFVDEQIGDLLELIDDDTAVAVVSACGAQALDGELNLNDWLIAQGDLALVRPPVRPAPIEQCAVDWSRTRAWAGDDGAIYLNAAGREPEGIVPPSEVEQVIASLRERLHQLPPPPGSAGGQPAIETYRPAALYGAVHGVAPDLLVVCARPSWRPSAIVGRGPAWSGIRDAPLDAACESPAGFFVIYDPHDPSAALSAGSREVADQAPGKEHELTGTTIYDIAPTLLSLLGQPIAPRLRGNVLRA